MAAVPPDEGAVVQRVTAGPLADKATAQSCTTLSSVAAAIDAAVFISNDLISVWR